MPHLSGRIPARNAISSSRPATVMCSPSTICRICRPGCPTRRAELRRLFQAARPIILNGIVITRSDLADRAIFLSLPPLPENRRRAKKEIWHDFEVSRRHGRTSSRPCQPARHNEHGAGQAVADAQPPRFTMPILLYHDVSGLLASNLAPLAQGVQETRKPRSLSLDQLRSSFLRSDQGMP